MRALIRFVWRAIFRRSSTRVVLDGIVARARAVPLGEARTLVPALVRAGDGFAAGRIDEALFDDLITVLSVGLGLPRAQVEALGCSLMELPPVVDAIARANGLVPKEGAAQQAGEWLAARILAANKTGTISLH